jgi:hypothetical protein
MITFESIGSMAVTCSDIGNESVVGKQVNLITEGMQPTYGVTAKDMGFHTFIMTVKWSKPRKNRMIPMPEIDDDIKSLMSAAKWVKL